MTRISSIMSARSTTTKNTTFYRGRLHHHRSREDLAPLRSETHGENVNGVAGTDESARKRTSSNERSPAADGYTNTTFTPRSVFG